MMRADSARKPARRGRNRGFGLLEVLVSLALFSLLGLVLFDWINHNLASATRLSTLEAQSHLREQASAWLQTRNPLREPEGEVLLDHGLRVRWRSRPLSPMLQTAPFPGGIHGLFKAQLLLLDVTLSGPALPPALGDLDTFTLKRVGFTRDASEDAAP